ncbi:S24 family peptidase [Bosea sp. 685]|uniref:S24 family peptidase n=1 Tax=Bosea sp. 685 TaxID=3080057 RepID=UPI002892BDB3|nr:S24 family peptidase [Bosea sp. 685]WNJ89131.1 S24 family peptidase [Bosea sp. 685]
MELILSEEAADLARRLDDTIERAGGRPTIAKRTGIPVTSLDRYCRQQSEPPATRIGLIAQACGVTTDYLILGAANRPLVMEQSIAHPDLDDDVVMIPLLDVVASAGSGIENGRPYEIRRLPFPRPLLQRYRLREQYARFLELRGDSMLPTFRDGSIGLIDVSYTRASDEGVYILIVGNDVRAKRVRLGWNGAIQLISDNPVYPDEQLAPPDAEALRVAGKLVWAGGEI